MRPVRQIMKMDDEAESGSPSDMSGIHDKKQHVHGNTRK